MGAEIKTWQIVDGKLVPISTVLRDGGRSEPYDLEPWLASDSSVVAADILLIGRQVTTRSGLIDLLAIDRSGNLVVIELKRESLPREVLAQAIDYASDVSDWTLEKISEVCASYTGKSLEDALTDAFPDIDIETLNINTSQRIILVGFSVTSSLERMIEWLSRFGVRVNALMLTYVKTQGGDELLLKTSVLSEELEIERTSKGKKFEIARSDDPGEYDEQTLRQRLVTYLNVPRPTNQRIRDTFLPALLEKDMLTRADMESEFVKRNPDIDPSRVGYYLAAISGQLGLKRNDFLRQVVSYKYPRHKWEKDDFSIPTQWRELVGEALREVAVSDAPDGSPDMGS